MNRTVTSICYGIQSLGVCLLTVCSNPDGASDRVFTPAAYSDEVHGFVKKANGIRGYTQILGFLDKYLRGTPTNAM